MKTFATIKSLLNVTLLQYITLYKYYTGNNPIYASLFNSCLLRIAVDFLPLPSPSCKRARMGTELLL